MNTSRHIFLSVVQCGLLATVGSASHQALADDVSEGSELPIVLTASRMHQPLAEAPAAITVIDRDMIEASGVRQLADLMRLVPGAVVGYEDGNRPVVTLRGMTGVFDSGLQVLIDGVSVYSPVFGGMYWSALPISLNDIERIEVVRGPNAASYGANSFHGVINIITKEPALADGFSANANMGGGGIRDTEIHGAGGQQDWRYRATLAQRYDTGFDSRPDTQRWTFSNLRGNYRVDAENSIDFSLRWGDERKDIGEYASKDLNKTPYSQFNQESQLQARWTWADSSDREWWIQAYHQRVAHLDRLNVDLGAANSLPISIPYQIEQDFLTQRDGIEFQSLHTLSPTLRAVWGGEWRRDAVFSERFFGTNEELSAFLGRAFGNVEWRLAPNWLLHVGTMFERNTLADNAWSPRIALVHEIVQGQTVRVSVSRAKRSPTLLEKFGNERFVAPPPIPTAIIVSSTGQVKSESVYSREIGYVFSFPAAALSGDARYFADNYTGLVRYVGNPPFVGLDAVNADEANTRGIDLTLNWQPLDNTHVRFAAGHTHIRSSNSADISVPSDTLSLLLTQTLSGGWSISGNYQRVSSMHWVDSGQGDLKIPAIDHLNLRLAKKFRVGAQEIEFAGVVQNALGHYRDYYLGSTQATPDNVAKRIAYLQMSFSY